MVRPGVILVGSSYGGPAGAQLNRCLVALVAQRCATLRWLRNVALVAQRCAGCRAEGMSATKQPSNQKRPHRSGPPRRRSAADFHPRSSCLPARVPFQFFPSTAPRRVCYAGYSAPSSSSPPEGLPRCVPYPSPRWPHSSLSCPPPRPPSPIRCWRQDEQLPARRRRDAGGAPAPGLLPRTDSHRATKDAGWPSWSGSWATMPSTCASRRRRRWSRRGGWRCRS